jgi:pantoate--beta-alanine ligase
MYVVTESTQLRNLVKQWRLTQDKIALVPTMGHLHAGHMSLVKIAQTKAQKTIVTIFVNPLQFNQQADLENYPRSLDNDLKKLAAAKVDLVFAPSIEELYPHGYQLAPRIEVPKLGDEFCGQYRPGHFAGVCTVITKLFNLCEPNIAVFGEKDYQQLLIIQQLVRDLNFDIKIYAGATMREADGLALSSRNALLSKQERSCAAHLYATLLSVKNNYSADKIAEHEEDAKSSLLEAGLRPEYLAIRDADNLLNITQLTENIIILGAAWLGDTRLIDNLRFSK